MEAKIVAQVVKSGGVLPDSIANAPELDDDLVLFWRAFWELSTARRYEAAPIPWDVVQLWANTYSITGDLLDVLHILVRELDTVFLEHVREKRDKERAAASKRRN